MDRNVPGNIFRFFVLPIVVSSMVVTVWCGMLETSPCFAEQGVNNNPVFAKPASGKLPDTGQTGCYDNTGEIPCPQPDKPFYGQDGNYAGVPMSFIDNGNGTATDTVTGLAWQRRDDGVMRNWTEAMGYCETLSLAGYEDWRLPSKKEIIGIVDYGRTDPAINPEIFPGTKRGWYWTSTPRAVDPTYAWGVFSANGRMHGSHKLGGSYAGHGRVYGGLKANDYYARCVRGGK